MREVIAPLLDHLDAREIPGPAADLRDPSAVNDTLAWLVDGGVVSVYADGAEPVWSIAPDHHHVAAFYRNGMLHHVLNRAVMELVMLDLATSPPEGDGRDAAWEKALALRPDYYSPMFNLAVLYRMQGDTRRAEDWFFRSLAAARGEPSSAVAGCTGSPDAHAGSPSQRIGC